MRLTLQGTNMPFLNKSDIGLNTAKEYFNSTYGEPLRFVTSKGFNNALNHILKTSIRSQEEVKLQKLIAMHPNRQDLKLRLLGLQKKQRSSSKPNKVKRKKKK